MSRPNRLKLLRRRLSVSAPRMIVRSHLPWPLRWIAVAVVVGFCAALGLWAFDLGAQMAGYDTHTGRTRERLQQLEAEVQSLRAERDRAQAVSNTADSLLQAEKTAQKDLAAQVRALQAENLGLKADLGFFERLMPTGGATGLTIRGLEADLAAPGQLHFQLLVMQPSHFPVEFKGAYELTLVGSLNGKPWTFAVPKAGHVLQFTQYQRVEGMVDYPAGAVVRQVEVHVLDASGGVRAKQTAML